MEIKISKKEIIGAILIVFSVGSLFYGAYYFGRKEAGKKYAQNSDTVNKSAVNANNVNQSETGVVDLASDTIKKGWIKWQEPQDLGDIGLTLKELYTGAGNDTVNSEGVKYLKVGAVEKGKYATAEILDVVSWVYEGPGLSSPSILRVLKLNGEFIFLTKNIENFDEYTNDFIKTYFFSGSAVKKINNEIVIEELVYPKELRGENERQNFVRNDYENSFFVGDKLKPVFVHSQFGQVWTTDEKKNINPEVSAFELNSHLGYLMGERKKVYQDIFGRYGFYLKAPDGTAVSYKSVIDIFEKQERFSKLQATWNNGKVNEAEYEINPSGCGAGDYVYNETLNVDVEKNLVLVGKSQKGDNLYGYKDATLAGFSKLYNDIYWTKDGKKKTAEEFLKINPKVFWVDPYGRTLAFYRADIISPAECGKPVIYLYPENDKNVHVEVAPGNGLSFTDPQYKNGWNVLARKNGELVNTEDGKTYPYLFWEGAGDVYYETPTQGFVVAKNDLNSFLDEKLAKLGLISQEISDFKEFWIPEMKKENKPYYFVTFLSKRYIDSLAPLSISPAPDTIIRVMMDFKGLEKPEKVFELKINTPERKGFTVVEWGGMLK
ncbi:MAG TPA: hypothetical protein P5232_02640 [Candidatus Moranbacteria bacterium]|nr:hypothetical protein [Candidatus Moranbacteria bacterium]